MTRNVRLRRRIRSVLIGPSAGILWTAGMFLAGCHSLPRGVPGPEAIALAHSMERAVGKDAWDRTGAVRWTFAGRHRHLWDRLRGLSRVSWGKNEVLLDTGKQQGRAYHNGTEVQGKAAQNLVKRAYSYFINDSFWLNPVVKFFDDGVERLLVKMKDGQTALLIQYRSGGLTPGDRYLWIPGPDGKPRAWRMWVSIIPVPGVQASWEGWRTLSTGAEVATVHKIVGFPLNLDDVAGAATLEELEPGPDPFAPLFR